MKLHLYMIAAAFGDPATNSLAQTVVGSWIAESPEVATAQFCSKYYFDGGARHALIGITALELAPDAMRQALATIEHAEQQPPKVVSLAVVPPNIGQEAAAAAQKQMDAIPGQLQGRTFQELGVMQAPRGYHWEYGTGEPRLQRDRAQPESDPA